VKSVNHIADEMAVVQMLPSGNLLSIAARRRLSAMARTRHELEERVLNCIPDAFCSMDVFDRTSAKMIAHEVSVLKRTPIRKASLESNWVNQNNQK
jgi:hypothetical protein